MKEISTLELIEINGGEKLWPFSEESFLYTTAAIAGYLAGLATWGITVLCSKSKKSIGLIKV